MNPSDHPFAPPGKPPADEDRLRASRRAAILGGLGKGSVVLGALASKPVLGAVPYHCTVSGQVSGNLSRPGDASICELGQSSSAWIDSAAWPVPLVKGTAPNNLCAFDAPFERGTNFNGYQVAPGPALLAAFFNAQTGTEPNQACSVQLPPATTNPATMLQVLMTTSADEKFVLGRVVVTSLLNAVRFAPNYPVSTNTIIWMFNATFNGGQYEAATGKFWTRDVVIWYLQSLYR